MSDGSESDPALRRSDSAPPNAEVETEAVAEDGAGCIELLESDTAVVGGTFGAVGSGEGGEGEGAGGGGGGAAGSGVNCMRRANACSRAGKDEESRVCCTLLGAEADADADAEVEGAAADESRSDRTW